MATNYTQKIGRPKGSTKALRKKQRAYRFPLDIIDFLDSQPEPSTWIIIDAIREKYNLPCPEKQNAVDNSI